MLAILFWFLVGLALFFGARYGIARWLGSDGPDESVDKSEIRMQGMMRWFTAFWPSSDTSKRPDSKG